MVNRRHSERVREQHGASKTLEYNSWVQMKQRCYNPKHAAYADYGGRGVRVCDAWYRSFGAFLSDVGHRPTPEHSIDRIDNNGNYEPGNVRWATSKEQARNRRTTIYAEAFGQRLPVGEWAERMGLPAGILGGRLNIGWDAEAALLEPVLSRAQTVDRAQRGGEEKRRIEKEEAAQGAGAERNPLERFRLLHRLSYGELAERLAMKRGTVHAYCTNLMSPSARRRDQIARATGREIPPDAEWPLPPRDAHRPIDPTSRRQKRRSAQNSGTSARKT